MAELKTRKNPGGRPKGRQNTTTILAREAISRFVDGNCGKLQGWLEEIAKTHGPLAAFKCFTDVVEYHVPKLARTEHTGADSKPIQLAVTWLPPQA